MFINYYYFVCVKSEESQKRYTRDGDPIPAITLSTGPLTIILQTSDSVLAFNCFIFEWNMNIVFK